MRSPGAPFVATVSAGATQPLVLVEIGFSVPLRLCSWGDLAWAGHDWRGASVRVEGLARDASGGAGCTVVVGNTDNEIGALLLNEGITDRAISVWEAWVDPATDELRVAPPLIGAGTGARVGLDAAQISVATANSRFLHAPREMISAAYGFNHLKPDGFKFFWNGAEITIRRRVGEGA